MVVIIIAMVTNRAAKASKPALFVAPAHIAIQTVLHQVSAFKIVAFNRCDDKYAHQRGGQW
jgi:hypothetical protein